MFCANASAAQEFTHVLLKPRTSLRYLSRGVGVAAKKKGQSERYVILLQQQEQCLLRSFSFVEMDEHMENGKKQETKPKNCLTWILLVSLSPIAVLVFMLMTLLSLLRFVFKASLLFIIVAINTPFAVMYNVSIVVIEYNLARFPDSSASHWYWPDSKANVDIENHVSAAHWKKFDPRANVGIEVQVLVSDFIKVVAGEFLLVFSTGIITYYTAPIKVFYISTVVYVVAVFHKWLNTDCLSKTALSCLCGGYGLNPMMFLFSFIGLFDIGCHPIAKCSFAARKAFIFLKGSNQNPVKKGNPFAKILHVSDVPRESNNTSEEVGQHPFLGNMRFTGNLNIEFLEWDAFERGLFQLSPRIDFIERKHGKYILKSFLVLKLHGIFLCEYPVERLELPEDYSKTYHLYSFLDILSKNDGFVTDKMRGRYEQSLTLLQIVEGVEENWGYKIVNPMDEVFVVAGCTDLKKKEED